MTWLSVTQTANVLDIHKRNVERMVRSRRVESRKIPSKKQRGKFVTEIDLKSLPIPAQNKYYEIAGAQTKPESLEEGTAKTNPATVVPSVEGNTSTDPLIWYHNLSAPERQAVDRKHSIISAIKDHLIGIETNKTSATRIACNKHKVTTSQYYRWLSAYEKQGLPGLADKRFGQSRSRLNSEHKNYIEQLIKQNPARRVTRIWEYVCLQYPEQKISGSTVSRFVKKWKTENAELYRYMVDPDKWKGSSMLSFGSHSEKAKHFLHYVELDSTPADVLCVDGKRYTLLGAIDVYSRKLKIQVYPSSSAHGVAALIRRVITDWGVPENVVNDNGKDYVANHIKAVYSALNIGVLTTTPFTPEEKPHIERVFRTLSTSFFEELEGFIGHNVAERKAIESRRTFAQRFMKHGQTVEVHMTPEELQQQINRWVDRVYHHKFHKGIQTTPELKSAQSTATVKTIANTRALDILLQPGGTAVVQKKGIHFNKAKYRAPELAGFLRQTVQIRTDGEDASKLYVFAESGEYICTAIDERLDGLSSADYTRLRKQQRKDLEQKKRAIETLRIDPMSRFLESAEKENTITALPRSRKTSTPALESAANAVLEQNGIKPQAHKSIAEQIEGDDWKESKDSDLDDLDFLDDIEIEDIASNF